MNGLTVGQNLLMQGEEGRPASFATVELVGAKVDGVLSLDGATVGGHLDMSGLTVGQSLFMRGEEGRPASFATVNLTYANLKQNLDVSDASFAELDLSLTRIEGELNLGSSGRSPADSRLVLLNTHAGAVRDWYDAAAWRRGEARDAWPRSLHLDGF